MQSFADVCLESDACEVEVAIENVEINPCDDTVCTLARAIQRLSFMVHRILSYYGRKCELRGAKFVELGKRAKSAAELVPEKITRTDVGADRSAHALISRSANEIAAQVRDVCGPKQRKLKN